MDRSDHGRVGTIFMDSLDHAHVQHILAGQSQMNRTNRSTILVLFAETQFAECHNAELVIMAYNNVLTVVLTTNKVITILSTLKGQYHRDKVGINVWRLSE